MKDLLLCGHYSRGFSDSAVFYARHRRDNRCRPSLNAPTYDRDLASATRSGWGNREVLESIVIPPSPRAFLRHPRHRVSQVLRRRRQHDVREQRHIGRDGQGRIYEERWVLVPKGSGIKSSMNWIQIADAKQHTLYNCSPRKHTCDLLVYDPADDLSAAVSAPLKSRTVQNEKGSQSWEDLVPGASSASTRSASARTASRTPVCWAPLALTSVTEYWHSRRIGLDLLSMRSSPFFGRQTFTITDLTAATPTRTFFKSRPVIWSTDQRKNPPISQ